MMLTDAEWVSGRMGIRAPVLSLRDRARGAGIALQCTQDPMVLKRFGHQDQVMTAMLELTAPMPNTDTARNSFAGGRDPAHELYDHAAGLLATAQALEVATYPPDAVAATAPTLACIETSLVALGDAVERLNRSALQRLMSPVLTTEDLRPLRADVSLRMERLAGILKQAALESAAAREALEPATAELTAV